MKKEKEFSYIMLIITFVVCCITVNVISCRKVELAGLIAPASIFLYPLSYLILTVFKEKYSKNKTIMLLNYAVIGILISALMIAFASFLPVASYDGLNALFDSGLRIQISAIATFYLSQNLHITLYNYLDYPKPIKFLISGVIAVTTDAVLFILLTYIGNLSLTEIIKLFTGQYVFNVAAIIIYTLIFAIIIRKYNKKDFVNKKIKKTIKKQK